jgi:hypothetical protein
MWVKESPAQTIDHMLRFSREAERDEVATVACKLDTICYITFALAITTDYSGRTVIAKDADWDHAVDGHPELNGREIYVQNAISFPSAVYEGNKGDREVFVAQNITTGFWKDALTVAVVRYENNAGYLVTAYLASNVPPRWILLWTK